MYVLSLEQVSLADTPVVGGKAAAAGELHAAGFPVPAGLCLTVPAFHLAIEPLVDDIGRALAVYESRAPGNEAQLALRMQKILARLTLPTGLLGELWQRAAALSTGRAGLAVRSSAVGEDARHSSLAGLYTTVLGVSTMEALAAAVLTCWRSYFSPGAPVLESQRAFDGSDGGMGVLIQPVVEAECGGVCYSVDPVRPDSGRVVISAAWGLPLGVVDGSVPSDTYWVMRDGFALMERRVVEKTRRVVLDPGGIPVPETTGEGQRRSAVLPGAWAGRIAEFGLAAEALFGSAQDVEWAIAGEHVWVLQSRPIASLPPDVLERPFPVSWQDGEDRKRRWLRTRPVGGERDLLLPLELHERTLLEATGEETCRLLGVNRNRDVKVVNGRLYVTLAPPPYSPGDGRIRRQAPQDLEERLAAQGLTDWDIWGPEIVRATERLAAFDPGQVDDAALAVHLEDALAARRRHFMLHPLCSKQPPGQEFVEIVGRTAGLGDSAAEALAQQLVGCEDSVLVRLMDEVYRLACLAQPDRGLVDLTADPPENVWQRLSAIPGSEEYGRQLGRILALYGDRNGAGYGSEAGVATPSWRERPQDVLHLAAVYLDPAVTPPQEARRRAAAEREVRVNALCAGTDPATAAEFRHLHRRACRLAAHLEEHNYYIDQLSVGQLRRAVLAAGDQLAGQGILAARDDVFWLRFDETLAVLREPAAIPVKSLILQRRGSYQVFSAMKAPPLLGLPDARLPQRPPVIDEVTRAGDQQARRVTGQGASAGQARGRARVICDTSRLPELKPGDILVTSNVGPLWTLYVPILAGLVLDEGSPGQHAAAVAREYGIPAVVATNVATERIPDRADVIVDGGSGTVEILA